MSSSTVQNRQLPEWFKLLPANAGVNSRDVAKLFGLTAGSLRNAVWNGSFPKPSIHHKGFTAHNACLWKPAVLRAEWLRQGGLP